MTELIFENLSLFVIFLTGLISYWVASGGTRASYKAFPVVLGVSIFSFVFLVGGRLIDLFRADESFPFQESIVIMLVLSVGVVALAYFWRIWISEKVFQYLRGWDITTTPFGPPGAWDAFESRPGRHFQHICVHLRDETMLESDMESLEDNEELGIPSGRITDSPIIDSEGNIALIVTRRWAPGAKEPEENNPVDESKRLKFTYIPASNITMIEVKVSHKQPLGCCG